MGSRDTVFAGLDRKLGVGYRGGAALITTQGVCSRSTSLPRPLQTSATEQRQRPLRADGVRGIRVVKGGLKRAKGDGCVIDVA